MIRDYFGERVAFYYSWVGFYTTWLIFPALGGLFVFLYGVATVFVDTPTYALFENLIFAKIINFTPNLKSKEICDPKGPGNYTLCPNCYPKMCDKMIPDKLIESCLHSRVIIKN